jgi:hypothetical protein
VIAAMLVCMKVKLPIGMVLAKVMPSSSQLG